MEGQGSPNALKKDGGIYLDFWNRLRDPPISVYLSNSKKSEVAP
jgi:hypothetical protein